jgi:hypothetical protein
MPEKNVIILMKSGREIQTCHNWKEIQQAYNENPKDTDMVISVTQDRGETSIWADIRKDCIEGYLNIE